MPRDPRRLRLQQFKRVARPVSPGFNHYADGAGLWGGDEIGLEGHEAATIGWEGLGTTNY